MRYFISLILLIFSFLTYNYIPIIEEKPNESINNEIFYNGMRLVNYDLINDEYSYFNNTDNQFQYYIPNSDNYYFNGNSITNNFKLIRVYDNSIEEICHFPSSEGTFPINKVNNYIYFIHCYYNSDKPTEEFVNKRCIARYDLETNTYHNIRDLNANIYYGEANEENIFYSTPNIDSTFNIYKYNITNKTIETIYNNLDSYRFIIVDNQVLPLTNSEYTNGSQTIDAGFENYHDGDYLIQVNGYDIVIINLRKNTTTEFDNCFAIKGYDNKYQIISRDKEIYYYNKI